jgi:hypothetical protein
MRSLICPLSSLRVDRNTVRITGFFMATMIALYAWTGSPFFVVAIALDYGVRAFTSLPYSAFSWLAHQIATFLKLPVHYQDKAPKVFAARVGFLFALATAVLYPISSMASLSVGLTLMGFALLESLLDLCVGCLVYTYLILPVFGKQPRADLNQVGSA